MVKEKRGGKGLFHIYPNNGTFLRQQWIPTLLWVDRHDSHFEYVESPQNPRGGVGWSHDKKCSCFSWTKLAVSRFPAVVSWPEASCKHHQYLLYIDKMASGRTACSGTFNIIPRRNRWCLHLRRPTVVWRNTRTSPIRKVCPCILLAPKVLLEDHWIIMTILTLLKCNIDFEFALANSNAPRWSNAN